MTKTILLIDDSPEDTLLIRRAFHKAGLRNPLISVSGGEEGIRYLSGMGEYSDRRVYPLPSVILLDLNMPGCDGFEVLGWMRRKLPVRGILVIVLSGADQTRDINRAYSLGANSFLRKPGNPNDFQELVNTFQGYWITTNRAPTIQDASGNSPINPP